MTSIEPEELRQRLRDIVTRNGKSGRIPELLEKELDELQDLISLREQEARIDEHQKLNLALDYTLDIREWSMHRLTEFKKETNE